VAENTGSPEVNSRERRGHKSVLAATIQAAYGARCTGDLRDIRTTPEPAAFFCFSEVTTTVV